MQEIVNTKLNFIKAFPIQLIKCMENINLEKVEEIRIRVNNPVILRTSGNEFVLKCTINSEEILNILQHFCNNSIYTYQNQICNGFITITGGHRVGISGSVVIKDGRVSNISNIFSLNIRIAKQIDNCSNSILQYVLNTAQNSIFNTLIVSPPRCTEKLLF